MGNKKKRVNTDPTMSMIRNIFQENLQLVNRVQRKSKSDIVTKYDLTEKLCARRMKAVAHLMPEMQERYAKTYPEIDIKSEFADIASLPVLSYDTNPRNTKSPAGNRADKQSPTLNICFSAPTRDSQIQRQC